MSLRSSTVMLHRLWLCFSLGTIFCIITSAFLIHYDTVQQEEKESEHQQQQNQYSIMGPSLLQRQRIQVRREPNITIGCQCVMCDSDPICGGLWKGDAVGGDASQLKNIHLVVSHCKNSLEWLIDFLTNDVQKHNIQSTVISKCGKEIIGVDTAFITPNIIRLPNVGGCDHAFAHWLHMFRQGTFSQIVPNTDVVVFLKDADRIAANIHQPGAYRSLNEMLRIASQNGFACGMEPTKPGWNVKQPTLISAYHDTMILQTFLLNKYSRWNKSLRWKNKAETTKGFKSKYQNLGDFHKQLQIEIPDTIVQVCYGGSFAVTRETIKNTPVDLWARLEQSLSRGDNIEEGHFVERTWAALLAPPLTNSAHIDALRKFSTSTLQREGSIIGALQKELTGN